MEEFKSMLRKYHRKPGPNGAIEPVRCMMLTEHVMMAEMPEGIPHCVIIKRADNTFVITTGVPLPASWRHSLKLSPDKDLIKSIRNKHQLTQANAAELLCRTREAWSQWERGTARMPPKLWEMFLTKVGE